MFFVSFYWSHTVTKKPSTASSLHILHIIYTLLLSGSRGLARDMHKHTYSNGRMVFCFQNFWRSRFLNHIVRISKLFLKKIHHYQLNKEKCDMKTVYTVGIRKRLYQKHLLPQCSSVCGATLLKNRVT